MLDLFLYDLAIHQVQGNNGVTHGRSYMKDKSRAADQDVFGTDQAALRHQRPAVHVRSDTGATFLAAAERYRLPEVIRRVATSRATFVDRTHMGAPLDLDQPFTTHPVSQVPGVSYDDPDAVPFWWSAAPSPPGRPSRSPSPPSRSTTCSRPSLFRPFKPLVDIAGGDPAVAASSPTGSAA